MTTSLKIVGTDIGAETEDDSYEKSVKSTPKSLKKKRQKNRTKQTPILGGTKDGNSTNADAEFQLPSSARKRKHSTHSPKINDKLGLKKTKTTKGMARVPTKMSYTVDGIKLSWSKETEFGVSFRAMTDVEQRAEVQRLNKGVEKGMKCVIKTKLLDDNSKRWYLKTFMPT